MATSSPRAQLVAGAFTLALGVLTLAMVNASPRSASAPLWVVDAAGGAFVLAGLAVIAGALGAERVQRWLGAAIALALLLVSGWIAFGPGERACSASVSLPIAIVPSELACRAAFGAGALLVALLLVLFALRALKR